MKSSNPKFRFTAIAVGVTLLITSIGMLVYWQIGRRIWCVRTVSISSHEVTYSWGCVQPQRFRQWSLTASVERQNQPQPSKTISVNRLQPINRDV